MSRLVGARGQQFNDPLYWSDCTLTGAGAQLALPRSMSRSVLKIQNTGTHAMAVEIGCAKATATLTSGVVTSFTIIDAGFGFKLPPIVELIGGGFGGNTTNFPVGQPGYPNPQGGLGAGGQVAQVKAVLTTGAVSSFTILNGGSGYQVPPYVFIRNADQDPFGAGLPAIGSQGFQLAAGASLSFEATGCPTDPVSVIGTSGDTLLVRWLD